MTYFEYAKWLLTNYEALKTSIVNQEAELERLYEALCPAGVANYDLDRGGPSTEHKDLSGDVQRVANDPTVKRLRQEIGSTKHMVECLERAMDSLANGHKEIIVKRYREKKGWIEIQYEVNLHERTCRRWHDQAIKTVAVAMWGPKAATARKHHVRFLSDFERREVV